MDRDSSSPRDLLGSLWRHRGLLAQLVHREVVVRHKGSVLGLAWSFLSPLALLAAYTFVFSVAIPSRWTTEGGRPAPVAMVLFAGLVVHGFLSEVLNRSPTSVTGQASLVKKVVFPLEVLPAVAVGAALFHTAASVVVLLLGLFVFGGGVPWTAVLLPAVFAPVTLLALGVAWILGSLGVYLRDVGPTVAIVGTMLLFLSPIFYPLSSVPPHLRGWLLINPLTIPVEATRSVLLDGLPPDASALGAYALVAAVIAMLGFAWFQRTRRGFADVL
jgi:lipopolysaccharide transport system permease protein